LDVCVNAAQLLHVLVHGEERLAPAAAFAATRARHHVVEAGGVDALQRILRCYTADHLGDDAHAMVSSLLEVLSLSAGSAGTSSYGEQVAARFLNLAASMPPGTCSDAEDNDDLTAGGVSKTMMAGLARLAGSAFTPEMRARLEAQGVDADQDAGGEGSEAGQPGASASASQKKRERKKKAAARKAQEAGQAEATGASDSYESPDAPGSAPDKAAPADHAASEGLPGGTKVVISGLCGEVVAYHEARGLFAVRVSGSDEPILLKRDNLAVAAAGDDV